ncbi:hypothetical protein GGS21DRAFT_535893 [Xylaria nigripes]|nr:hypothetical protein GGS21DRAFT_535893 [Xylaria nigripes]
MRLSNRGSVAIAMVASLATAAPHNGELLDVSVGLLGSGGSGGSGSSSSDGYETSHDNNAGLDVGLNHGNGLDLSKPVSVEVDLGADLSGKVLVAGVVADVAVNPVAAAAAGAEVSVVCEECHVKGEIEASVSLANTAPALSLSLKDVEVLLNLNVHIGAAATIAVNLVSPAKASFPLPGLNVDALVYLDLVLGVHAELDLSAGVYVSLPEALIETDILNGDILNTDLSGGVTVKVLPIKVRIGCTELLADLRLRVDLAVSAGVDANEALPLGQLVPGLQVPTIGAGVEAAVYVNLLEYIGLFCATPDCPLIKDSYGLNVGAAVAVGVEVENLLSVHLAPTISTALLNIPTQTLCTPSVPYTPVVTIPGGSGPSTTGFPTITGPGSAGVTPTGNGPSALPPYGYSGGLRPTVSVPMSLRPLTTPAPGTDSLASIGNSIIGSIETFTVTACAVNVANCPPGFQTGVTITHTPKPTDPASFEPTSTPGSGNVIGSITQQLTTMSSCSITSTFVAPPEFTAPPFPVATMPVPAGTISGSPSGPSATDGILGSIPVVNGSPSNTAGHGSGSPTDGILGGIPVNNGSPSNTAGQSGSTPAAGSAAGNPTDSHAYPGGPLSGVGSVPTGDLPNAGDLPVGGLPAGGLPTGIIPSGLPNAGSVPVGGLPTGIIPSGLPNAGGLPTGVIPSGLPNTGGVIPDTGYIPAGGLPSDGLPTGGLPTGIIPDTGSVPAGGLPSAGSIIPGAGSVPVGGLPTGTLHTGVIPSGLPNASSLPTGVIPSLGSVPTGSLPTGDPSDAADDDSDDDSDSESQNGEDSDSDYDSYPADGSADAYPTQDPADQSNNTPGQQSAGSSYPVPVVHSVAHAFVGGSNSSKPQAWSTSVSSFASATGKPDSSHPSGPSHSMPATAGVSKLSSSIAAAIAFMGAVLAL